MTNVQPNATQTRQLVRGPTMERTTIVPTVIVSSRYCATLPVLIEVTEEAHPADQGKFDQNDNRCDTDRRRPGTPTGRTVNALRVL